MKTQLDPFVEAMKSIADIFANTPEARWLRSLPIYRCKVCGYESIIEDCTACEEAAEAAEGESK